MSISAARKPACIPFDRQRIPHYFKENFQLESRIQFEEIIFKFWQKAVARLSHEEKKTDGQAHLPFEKLPTGEFKNPYLEKVVNHAWEEYRTICDHFSRGAVLNWNGKGGRATLEELSQINLKEIMVAYNSNLHFPILLLNFSELVRLIQQDQSLLKQLNFSEFIMTTKDKAIVGHGSFLLMMISLTEAGKAMSLIDIGMDVNQYSTKYGNTPLLLAVTKGWNHIMTEAKTVERNTHNQQLIIRRLLEKPELDVNAIHIFNGMTALHIACLRGDDCELIKLLINKGAKTDIKDYLGRTPSDMLALDFTSAQKIIKCLSSDDENPFLEHAGSEHLSYVATLPPKKEFFKNKLSIRDNFFPLERKLDFLEEQKPQDNNDNAAVENEEKQKLNSSCYVWLKIIAGAVLVGGSIVFLIFFPYLLASPFLKVTAGVSALGGIGLFYQGCREIIEARESKNATVTFHR